MTQPTVTVGSRRGRHTPGRFDPAASLRVALDAKKAGASQSTPPTGAMTALGFGDRPGEWSEPPAKPGPGSRPTRRAVMLPNTLHEAIGAATSGNALPRKKLRMPSSRVGADLTSQLWATSDVSEMVTAMAPVRSARMEFIARWVSPTVTTLLVVGFGLALRIAAG